MTFVFRIAKSDIKFDYITALEFITRYTTNRLILVYSLPNVMIKLGILISGRGSNMTALLKAVKSGKIRAEPAIVIANRDAAGLQTAKKMGVKTMIVPSKNFAGTRSEYDAKIETVLREYGVTPRNGLVCLAGFMRILGPELVTRYKNRILNVHPALLPAFRGLDAQRQALEYGACVTGCTVHFVDADVDTGPIIVQRTVDVRKNDNLESLTARILVQEHKAYVEAVSMVADKRIRINRRRVVYT